MTRCALLLSAVGLERGTQRRLVEFKDYLTTAEGGLWREDEILICGPLTWPAAQLLASRLRRYDCVLLYACALTEREPVPLEEFLAASLPCAALVRDTCAEVLSAGEAEALEALWDMAGGTEEMSAPFRQSGRVRAPVPCAVHDGVADGAGAQDDDAVPERGGAYAV